MAKIKKRPNLTKLKKSFLWMVLVTFVCFAALTRANAAISFVRLLAGSNSEVSAGGSLPVNANGLVGQYMGARVEDFIPEELTKLTNEERTKAGLNTVTLNANLNQSASAKCADMVAKDYWAHNSPEGQSPWVFFEKAGYRYSKAGENLAYGYASNDSVISGWMNSPGHRANILGEGYADVGFGICEGENYMTSGHQVVIVQHFGSPAPQPVPISRPVYVPKPYVAPVCTKTPIPYKTNYISVSYLYEDETNEYGGTNGYLEQCTTDSAGYRPADFTYPAYDKTIYVGTKPRQTTSP